MNTGRIPKLGFVGVGWIGKARMQALIEAGAGQAVALVEPSQPALQQALQIAPHAAVVDDVAELLRLDLDGVVIATPSAMHAAQAITALQAGKAVFCQKPLGRNAEETRQVVRAAQKANRLLGVDLSYRHTEALRALKKLVGSGELGRLFALEMVFHNAYGPDKPWFYQPDQAGGGCVIDLGIHLVDAALWLLGFPAAERVSSQLFAQGRRLRLGAREVEDYALATIELAEGPIVRLGCSWNLPAGCDAVIGVQLFGTGGGAAMRNVHGSFYDFVAERYRKTQRELLTEPPDAWGGRALVAWARQLRQAPRFDRSAEQFIQVAQIVDRLYGRECE